MLVPAGVLVLVMLGALSVDTAVAYMAKRELSNAADAAVNDAVTVALTPEALQRGDEGRPDGDRAAQVVRQALVGRRIAGGTVRPEDVVPSTDGDMVTVEVQLIAPRIFGKAIPGTSGTVLVRARSQAQLDFRQG